ncbi:hypothetical protein Taro_032353 [Colocasia esculenta]|uniref:Uncharacterized protein n=1 Tax=Colocasia esculenta TaxID=4460 RepID=A0A843VSG1_COLES|nr:hypothetical protein [Colocasia esculenta]
MEHPFVCLPTDVAAMVRIATSVDASPRPVLLVVPASVFSRFRGPILGCQPVMAPAFVASRPGDVLGRCTEHCFRFVPDSVGFCGSRVCATTLVGGRGVVLTPYWALFARLTPYFFQLGAHHRGSSVSDELQRWLWRCVLSATARASVVSSCSLSELGAVFCKSSGLQLLLCPVRGECGRSACSCRSGAVGAGLTGSGLPCVEDACEPVQVRCSWSSSAHLSVCASRRLREPAYGVAFTGAGLLPVELVEDAKLSRCFVCGVASPVERCDTCLWSSSAWLRCIAWLPCVLVRFPRTVCCCSGEGFSQDCFVLVSTVAVLPQSLRCAVGLAGAFWRVFPRAVPWWFWWRFSQDQLVFFLRSPFVASGGGSSQECYAWWSRECHGARMAVLRMEVSVSVVVLPLACGRDSCMSPSSAFHRLLGVVVLHYGVVLPGCASLRPSGGVIFPLVVFVLSWLLPSCVSVALLCTDFLVGLLVQALFRCMIDCASAYALKAFRVVVLVVGLSIGHDRGLGLTWPVALFQACGSWRVAFDVFRASVAVCHIVEYVIPSFCGSACVWFPCRTTRKVWVRPSGDSGCRFCVLKVLHVRLLSLLNRKEATVYSIRFRWRRSALLTDVSRVAADKCALCRVFLATEWVAGRWVTIVRSVGDCNCEDFSWRFLLFGPNLASLGTWGCRSVWAPHVWLELSPFPGTPILGSPLREVWNAEGFRVLSWRRPDSPLSHRLSLRWLRSHVVVSDVRPQLGQAAVLRVLCVSMAALSRHCTGIEAGARLASKACGLRVPLLAASGGGLVAVVVTAPVLLVVPALVFSRFRGPILGCQPVMAPVGLDRCAEHCFRFVPDSVGFCGSRVSRGSSSRELGIGRVVEAAVAPCVVSSSESEHCELL